MIITIEHPNGYLLDQDGNVVDRFGLWETGQRDLSGHPHSDAIESVDYVNSPGDHDRDIHDDYLDQP